MALSQIQHTGDLWEGKCFPPREVSVLGKGGRKDSIFLHSVGIYMGTASQGFKRRRAEEEKLPFYSFCLPLVAKR